jgi:serine/threonine protein kinase
MLDCYALLDTERIPDWPKPESTDSLTVGSEVYHENVRYEVVETLQANEDGVCISRVTSSTGAVFVLKSTPGTLWSLYRNELDALRCLQGCPHIPPLVDYFTTDTKRVLLHIVIPYYSSGDLFSLIDGSDGEKLAAILGMAKAVKSVHDMGWVHDDLKPSNFVQDNSGEVVAIDFQSMWQQRNGPPAVPYGTEYYNAPEKIYNPSAHGCSADIFSLGVSAWVLYEGCEESLYARVDDAVANAEPGQEEVARRVAMFALDRDLPFLFTPTEVRPFIRQMLSGCPADRPKIDDVIAHLGRLLWCDLFAE